MLFFFIISTLVNNTSMWSNNLWQEVLNCIVGGEQVACLICHVPLYLIDY